MGLPLRKITKKNCGKHSVFTLVVPKSLVDCMCLENKYVAVSVESGRIVLTPIEIPQKIGVVSNG